MIYFIQCEATKLIKIGTTERNAGQRLSNLQTGSASRLMLLAIKDGGKDEEEKLHSKFSTDRVRGEWFKPSDELQQVISLAAKVQSDSAAQSPIFCRPKRRSTNDGLFIPREYSCKITHGMMSQLEIAEKYFSDLKLGWHNAHLVGTFFERGRYGRGALRLHVELTGHPGWEINYTVYESGVQSTIKSQRYFMRSIGFDLADMSGFTSKEIIVKLETIARELKCKSDWIDVDRFGLTLKTGIEDGIFKGIAASRREQFLPGYVCYQIGMSVDCEKLDRHINDALKLPLPIKVRVDRSKFSRIKDRPCYVDIGFPDGFARMDDDVGD